MNLFVTTPLNAANQSLLLAQLPPKTVVYFKNQLPEKEKFSTFQNADYVLGNPPVGWWKTPPPALKFWQLDSAGFDVYKHLVLTIPVCNVGDYFAWPCAESIVAGIMALYRHIDQLAVLQTQKKWVGTPLRFSMKLLHKQQVVVLGAGAIGLAVRRILEGFECRVKLMARTNPAAQIHTTSDLRAALPHTDLVISCLPGTANGFFTADLIAAMKPGSVFANVGRGSTVDEPALIAALQAGHLSGAVLDVTANEPLPAENPLWEIKNVLLTQHTAGGSDTEDAGKIAIFVDNLNRFLNNQPLKNQIDSIKGY